VDHFFLLLAQKPFALTCFAEKDSEAVHETLPRVEKPHHRQGSYNKDPKPHGIVRIRDAK